MKTLIQFLHGNWFGHPLHPMLVNVPMALWPAALVFDLLSHVGGSGGPVLVHTAFWSILLGLVVALAAVATGLADWSEVGRDKPAWKLGLAHLILNAVAFVVWAVNLCLRIGMAGDAPATPATPLALSGIGTAILVVAAYLGGRMVYDYGTSVGWMSIKEWRRRAVVGGANVPEEG